MRKNTKFTFGMILLAILLALPHDVRAAAGSVEDFIPTEKQLESGAFIGILLDAMNVVAWLGFDLIDTLLDPDFLFNTVNQSANTSQIYLALNQIWVLSRNIMNIVFAVILVIAAIYTTIRADLSVVKDNFGRFVLAVVLVNFSWLFPLMIIDFANIMTNVVYGIPSEIAAGSGAECKVPNTKTGGKDNCKIVVDVIYFPEESGLPDENNNCNNPRSMDIAEECDYTCALGLVCYKTDEWNANVPKYKTIIHGLVYNYAKLGDLARLPNTAAPSVGNSTIRLWLMYITRQMLTLVIMAALAFPLLAMALAFLIRIPVLWVTTAFMPFFFVGWVLEGKIPGAEKTKGILNEFIKAAFLPVVTAIPLTIGFIMMNALASTNWQLLGNQLKSSAPLTAGVTTIFDILWLCMVLGIMWKGTFDALRDAGGISNFAGETIRGLGQSLGKSALMLPAFAPILPGKVSPKAVWDKINPRRLEQGLKNSSSLGEALNRIRNQPTGTERLPTRDELRARNGEAPIQNAATAAATAPSANEVNAIRNLEAELERQFNKEIRTNDEMIEALRHLNRIGTLNDAQLRTLEERVTRSRPAV